MKLTGTIINYYFHCKRQCYLFANRLNLENNSEDVRIGRVLHELEAKNHSNSELKFDNFVIDKLTSTYVIELKKSDSDVYAAKMQLLFYLRELANKGIYKKGKLVFDEKNITGKSEIIELNEENIKHLRKKEKEILTLIEQGKPPGTVYKNTCKKCAYYEYCYV